MTDNFEILCKDWNLTTLCTLREQKNPSAQSGVNGIGTLGEKTLHYILKQYYEPDESKQEIKVGRFVADIKNDAGIIEIQTRGFHNLRRKLEAFLPEYEVTVVYPVALTKWLLWIDESTGEITKKRKSPKVGIPCEICWELYKIKSLLLNPNLHFRIPLLQVEEYRILNGWSTDGKKGSTRYERIPVALTETIEISSLADYRKLLPHNLPEIFTVKDFQKAAKMSLHMAGIALHVLNWVGAVKRIGKTGNSYLYHAQTESGSKEC